MGKSNALRLSLVMGIDFMWGMLLSGPGKTLLMAWLAMSGGRAQKLIDDDIEPMLWWSYGLIYLGQVWWFLKTAKSGRVTEKSLIKARKQWWLCLVLLISIGFIQRYCLVWFISPDLPSKAFLLLVIVLMVDIAVVYWLPSLLMTPQSYLPSVPGGRLFRRKPT